jgi:uncharacterized protein (UPF0332 family)
MRPNSLILPLFIPPWQCLFSSRATHRRRIPVRSRFSKIAKDNALLGSDLGRFLARAYDYKDAADYRFEAAIPREDAEAAIASALDMIQRIRRAIAG